MSERLDDERRAAEDRAGDRPPRPRSRLTFPGGNTMSRDVEGESEASFPASDPPSWSGSATVPVPPADDEPASLDEHDQRDERNEGDAAGRERQASRPEG